MDKLSFGIFVNHTCRRVLEKLTIIKNCVDQGSETNEKIAALEKKDIAFK